ncbi:MAG: BglG family transcription antiterminator [Faecalicoccus sp.]|uniref:BglG family transcription antiterminator n=1 Tax=Faecalicoccus sp. TaxID=1971758 RepID=UPI002F92BB59
MVLDERALALLQYIVDNPNTSGNQLQEEFKLSRKQISYSLEKVNYYLAEFGYPKIERLKTGRFIVPNSVVSYFKTSSVEINQSQFVYSELDRQNLIVLILLNHSRELGIYNFVSSLQVSKNTILKDIKKIQKYWDEQNDLKILYNRNSGYAISGKEFEKRRLLIKIVRNVLKNVQGESILQHVLEIDVQHLNNIKERVMKVEKDLEVEYTDVRVREIPYILYLVLRRVERDRHLDVLPESYLHIAGTNEYGVVMDVFEDYKIGNAYDRLYMVSLFQASSTNMISDLSLELEKDLVSIVNQVLKNYESLVNYEFSDFSGLRELLIQHCKPAIYRMLYGYHIESNILEMILPQHAYLHEITRQSIKPLEEYIGKKISDEELAYVTIIFGGWMTKEGALETIEGKKKAIVVCTNGVSISNYLFINLRESFPEFEFSNAMSLRGFEEYTEQYDLVFTTIPLKTEIPQFIVRPIMDSLEIEHLRTKVLSQIRESSPSKIKINLLMDIIDRYADVSDQKGLETALNHYFDDRLGASASISMINQKNIELSDLLTEETIIFTDENLNWMDAIEMASKPLFNQGYIERRYVDRIIEEVKTEKPFWNIAKNVIIAHAGIEDGVNHLGMSMLKSSKPIVFHENMSGDILIILATKDYKEHLSALYRLIDITENEKLSDKFHNSKNIEDIRELILKED